MAREFFKDLPNTTTPLTASRLNGLLNGDEALGSIIVDDVNGKNLFSGFRNGNYDSSTGAYNPSGNGISTAKIKVTSGQTYFLTGISNATIRILYWNDNTYVTSETMNITSSGRIITPQGNYLAIQTGTSVVYSNVQLEKGSTATEYTEYKQPVKKTSIGVKEDTTFYANDFKCRNVFNSKIYIKDINVGVSVPIFNFKLKPNTTYTMSTNMPQDSSVADIFVGGGILSTLTTASNGVWLNNPRTFTTDNDGNVTMSYRKLTNIGDFTTFWYQIEIGDEVTPYTPYKNFENEEIYSTNEIVIGRWIDGKPLYRKVISVLVNANTTSNTTLSNEGITNTDTIIINIGKSTSHYNINVVGGAYNNPNYYSSSSDFCNVYVDGSKVMHIVNNSGTQRQYYICLEYTKSTD